MPSIDKLRHNIRHAVSLSAFSPNLIHRIRYFFLYTVTFRDYSYNASRRTSILQVCTLVFLLYAIPTPKIRPVYLV